MKIKGVQFDERKDLEAYVESEVFEEEHIGRTIYRRARYNYYIKNLTDKKNYNEVVKFITENSTLGLTELELYELVQKTIREVKKRGLKLVDHIYLRQSEMDFIVNLNDIKLEKIAFVLLCLAKYHNEVSEEADNCIYFKLNEIKNMARINMSKKDFEYFYNNMYAVGALLENNNPTSTIQIVNFVSYDENDSVVMEVQEVDYLELAYLYLSWKNDGNKYGRCSNCNRLMRQGKTKPRKYCEECAAESTKASWKEASQRYRDSKKDKSS